MSEQGVYLAETAPILISELDKLGVDNCSPKQ